MGNRDDVSEMTGWHLIYKLHDVLAARAVATHIYLQQYLFRFWQEVRLSCLRLRLSPYVGPPFCVQLQCLSELKMASNETAQTGLDARPPLLAPASAIQH